PNRGDQERRPQPDPGPQRPANERAERADTVVHDHVGTRHARPQTVGDERRLDRAGRDVEDHHPEARQELGGEQEREDLPMGAARERNEHERSREQDAAQDERGADAHPSADPAREDRAEHAAYGSRSENEPATSAAGAERICTSSPPTLGPPTKENARLPFKSEFASR